MENFAKKSDETRVESRWTTTLETLESRRCCELQEETLLSLIPTYSLGQSIIYTHMGMSRSPRKTVDWLRKKEENWVIVDGGEPCLSSGFFRRRERILWVFCPVIVSIDYVCCLICCFDRLDLLWFGGWMEVCLKFCWTTEVSREPESFSLSCGSD